MSEELDPRAVEVLREQGWWLATAESLTAGQVASSAARSPFASTWLRGGVIAFSETVKRELLGVAPGPVVNARTAAQMARGVAKALRADVAVSTTGVGGPDPVEGCPPGTVHIGILVRDELVHEELHLEGDPGTVCHEATRRALDLVSQRILRVAGAGAAHGGSAVGEVR